MSLMIFSDIERCFFLDAQKTHLMHEELGLCYISFVDVALMIYVGYD